MQTRPTTAEIGIEGFTFPEAQARCLVTDRIQTLLTSFARTQEVECNIRLRWGSLRIFRLNANEHMHTLSLASAKIDRISTTQINIQAIHLNKHRGLITLRFMNASDTAQWLHDLRASSNWKIDNFYKFLTRLGHGAYGQVFSCQKRSRDHVSRILPRFRLTGRTHPTAHLACKQIHIRDYTNLDSLFRELEVSAMLRHENVLETFDILVSNYHVYIIMPRMHGSLHDYIETKTGSVLSENEAKHIILKLLRGISYLHLQLRMLHRDIKLLNVLIDPNPVTARYDEGCIVRICDFGHATSLPPTLYVPFSRMYGTLVFCPPETIQRRLYSKAGDMWALGVTAFTLVCGEYPFFAPRDADIERMIVYHNHKNNRTYAQRTPACRELIDQCLRKNHVNRVTVSEAIMLEFFNSVRSAEENEALQRTSRSLYNLPARRSPSQIPATRSNPSPASGGSSGPSSAWSGAQRDERYL